MRYKHKEKDRLTMFLKMYKLVLGFELPRGLHLNRLVEYAIEVEKGSKQLHDSLYKLSAESRELSKSKWKTC